MKRFLLWVLLLSSPSVVAHTQVIVTGNLLGADRRPMQQAHVVVKDGPIDTLVIAQADAGGHFAFTLSEPGGYGMYLMGVHHETLTIPFIPTQNGPVELEVHLTPAVLLDDPDSLHVVMPGEQEGILMERRADGTFGARIPTDADTLAYQIHGIKTSAFYQKIGERRTYQLTGTQMDRLVFNQKGPFWDLHSDYFSVVDVVDGVADIVFDPRMLKTDTMQPVVHATPQVVADLVDIYLDVDERFKQFGIVTRAYEKGAVSDEQWWELLDEEQSAIRQQLQRAALPADQQVVHHDEGLHQQWMLLQYMDKMHPTEADSILGYQVLNEVPPTSPFWSYYAWYTFSTSNLLFRVHRLIDDDDALLHYIDTVIEQHSDQDVRTQFRYAGTGVAVGRQDSLRLWRYYDDVMATQPDSRIAQDLRRRYAKDRVMQMGNPMPNFAFVALDDSSITYTNAQLRGRVYLMDVWGTWCAPCVAEVPYLEAAYERYHELGLEILSVAFMDDKAAIDVFREERYPMPWLHTLVVKENDEAVRSRFEITGFPRPILVDEQGIIIAIDKALRGEKLDAALAPLFRDQ